MSLFECVPNFSEGRDAEKIDRIVAAGRGVPGTAVLDVERNADHNRCVVSLAGEGPSLVEAVFRMVAVAVATIDLTTHRGEHPRMGAVDVVPFVPLGESTMAQAVALAEQLGERVWRELNVPVYLYAEAARRPERADLARVRQGQFEGIRESIATDPARAPDIGEARVHPTAGISGIGARPVLIAFNAYLSTPDVAIAKKVAHATRARDGGLAEVKALGFDIKERHQAQVSMNLTDYRKTPIHRALEMVRREAARYGASVEESEVVGLVPEDAMFDASEFYLQLNAFDRTTILERKLRAALAGPGLSAPGGPASGPASSPPAPASTSAPSLVSLTLTEFAARLAQRSPTPGGGSAAAAAGALGAALGEMVIAYTGTVDGPPDDLRPSLVLLQQGRERFLRLVDEDSQAFDALRAARRYRKEHPDDDASPVGVRTALGRAADVPLATAQLAVDLLAQLSSVGPRTKSTMASDLIAAQALLAAARDGALANVRINLPDLVAAGAPTGRWVTEVDRLSRLPP